MFTAVFNDHVFYGYNINKIIKRFNKRHSTNYFSKTCYLGDGEYSFDVSVDVEYDMLELCNDIKPYSNKPNHYDGITFHIDKKIYRYWDYYYTTICTKILNKWNIFPNAIDKIIISYIS